MRFSPPLQVLERGPGGEVSESPAIESQVHHETAPFVFGTLIQGSKRKLFKWETPSIP